MSNVFFIGDMHFGHKNIIKYGRKYPDGTDPPNIDLLFDCQVECYNSVVRKKKDVVYLLGDIWFDHVSLHRFAPQMNGIKILVKGNHDYLKAADYLLYCDDVHGLHKRYGVWLSHAPIHPQELRGCPNVHGHIHHKAQNVGSMYYNVNIDVAGFFPTSLDEIKTWKKSI